MHDAVDHITRNSRQPRIQALELHRQAFVVDSQQVQHSRVEIVNADGIFLSRVA